MNLFVAHSRIGFFNNLALLFGDKWCSSTITQPLKSLFAAMILTFVDQSRHREMAFFAIALLLLFILLLCLLHFSNVRFFYFCCKTQTGGVAQAVFSFRRCGQHFCARARQYVFGGCAKCGAMASSQCIQRIVRFCKSDAGMMDRAALWLQRDSVAPDKPGSTACRARHRSRLAILTFTCTLRSTLRPYSPIISKVKPEEVLLLSYRKNG